MLTTALTHCGSKTLQTTEAMFLSGFGWGLTKKIENYGLAKFKANLQRVSLVLYLFSVGLYSHGCSLERASLSS